MNSLIPLFIVVPLGSAFIMAILGRFIKDFGKYLINLGLLFLVGLTVKLILNSQETLIYKVGGFANAGDIPIAIYMVVDGFTKILLLIISVVGFLVALCLSGNCLNSLLCFSSIWYTKTAIGSFL